MTDRFNVTTSRTPIQAGLSISDKDYAHYRMRGSVVGVVLSVNAADDPENLYSTRVDDGHGSTHTCTVLVVEANQSTSMVLSNVVIPPQRPSGLDSYDEFLPRGSSNLVTGEELRSSLSETDPAELDGDYCVVSFVGDSLDQPYVSSWWPHPKNFYDPQTTGQAYRQAQGSPRALKQGGRSLTRINGVEFVVTKKGNLYLTTRFASSTLKFGEEAPTEGRWAREEDPEVGGSILINPKESQSLELVWDKIEEGKGIMGGAEAQIPQSNPKGNSGGNQTYEQTYLFADKETFSVQVPKNFKVKSGDEAVIEAENLVLLEASGVKLGKDASQPAARGTDLHTFLGELTVLTATGPAKINPVDIARFVEAVLSTKVTVE